MPTKASPFRLAAESDPYFRRVLSRSAERALALDRLTGIYEGLPDTATPQDFLDHALGYLNIEADLDPSECARIPTAGPTVVVANHPFGGIDGMLLARELIRVRPDVKMMANFLLTRIPELAPMIIQADPFTEGAPSKTNHRAVKDALSWLRDGHLLLVFPAGEVSSYHFDQGEVTDPRWSSSFLKLARRANASVTPLFVHGRNSLRFQLAGMIHPRLRTILLPRELLNKTNQRFKISVGNPLAPERLQRFDDDSAATQWIRQTVYVLAQPQQTASANERVAVQAEVIAVASKEADADHLVRAEVDALPADRWLGESGLFAVFFGRAAELPYTLHEIARLRELTFRAVGEGTGSARDMDRFDDYYTHIVLWDKERRQVAGGYRLGLTDQILSERGLAGLYTHGLFRYRRRLLEKLHPAIELGRSFVVAEHQKSYAPLMLLWRGIATFVARNPSYRYLFGPVSISNDYTNGSKALLVEFLKAHLMAEDLTGLVRPKHPFRAVNERLIARLGAHVGVGSLLSNDPDMENIGGLIEDLEGDGKSVPVLLRQYVKLGGRILGFNVDADFGNSIDCLILVDFVKADERSLKRYMGADEYEAYIRHHQLLEQRASA